MKTKLFFIGITAFIMAGCNQSCNNNNKTQTHTHEDGSIHADHPEENVPAQESFVIDNDSLLHVPDSVSNHEHEQSHEHGPDTHTH